MGGLGSRWERPSNSTRPWRGTPPRSRKGASEGGNGGPASESVVGPKERNRVPLGGVLGPSPGIDNDHGSLNVPIEHHPTIRYMVYNGYYKVMSNIPKMGQLPTPDDAV